MGITRWITGWQWWNNSCGAVLERWSFVKAWGMEDAACCRQIYTLPRRHPETLLLQALKLPPCRMTCHAAFEIWKCHFRAASPASRIKRCCNSILFMCCHVCPVLQSRNQQRSRARSCKFAQSCYRLDGGKIVLFCHFLCNSLRYFQWNREHYVSWCCWILTSDWSVGFLMICTSVKLGLTYPEDLQDH